MMPLIYRVDKNINLGSFWRLHNTFLTKNEAKYANLIESRRFLIIGPKDKVHENKFFCLDR